MDTLKRNWWKKTNECVQTNSSWPRRRGLRGLAAPALLCVRRSGWTSGSSSNGGDKEVLCQSPGSVAAPSLRPPRLSDSCICHCVGPGFSVFPAYVSITNVLPGNTMTLTVSRILAKNFSSRCKSPFFSVSDVTLKWTDPWPGGTATL